MNNDRIRVAHVTFGLDVGGLEKQIVQFAKHADPSRYHLTVASLGHIGSVGEQLRSMNVPVVCMHRDDGFHPGLMIELYRFFRKIRADVVHSHDSLPLIYAAPAARLAGVRSIIHTQHGRGFGLSSRQEWMARQASRLTHQFVAISQDIRDRVIEMGVESKRVSVIRPGLGGNDFERDRVASSHHDRPYVVCLAKLCPEKGVSTLIDAASQMLKREPAIEVLIAGDGVCRAELQGQIYAMGLEKRVRLIGETDRVAELLGRARVFVLPSKSDGGSFALLEAMFAGVPIVATDVGGTTDVIRDDINGRLVPPQDPTAMANAIVDLWNDANTGARLVAEGHRIATNDFDIQQVLCQYEAHYELSLDERRKSSRGRARAKVVAL
ncbi:Alpha-D-kanosaminyltransferase [Rubripirellula tenax]|uniref:Alpha-D-kanosaminyltransferase n=1 Tax=Rubripirellula tenax TaxID=2528015 RepID=A0A5C6EGI5_9BACT|nr:glycosyltransferase [Rubripirellula tenax]TWU47555.1 Alpha-D-kanosaminyltransferase [Rubripirellula tenax]